MSKFLLTDVDGCVLNWHVGFIRFAEQLGFIVDPTKFGDNYDMSTWFTNMTTEQFRRLTKLFNNSQFSNLCQPYKDAMEWLPRIAKNNRVEALTAFGNRPEQKEMRMQLLHAVFPNVFDEIHVIDLGECKKQYLKRLRPDLFVEDSLNHANSAIELDIETWVVPTAYNVSDKHDYLDQDEPWYSLYKIIGE